jgi:hypothetical protein
MVPAPTFVRSLGKAAHEIRSRTQIGIAILLALEGSSVPASACPVCHTETGDKIRQALFGPDFWFNVGATILPFAIFVTITALIYYGFPTGARNTKSERMTLTQGEAL